jgi:hypothetical protein
VRDRVIEALLAWKLPRGDSRASLAGAECAPVVARALRREEAFEGPFVERAPDVVVELALDEGYGLSLVATPWRDGDNGARRDSVRELAGHELAGGRGLGMNGTHRADGIFVATGQPLGLASAAAPRLADMAPTLLGAMGIEWSEEQRDGTPLLEARREYSEEEDALVTDRLRALGYLE